MIRRSPCERYIKFLLSHPNAFSIEDICNKLQEMGLDYASEWYLERLKKRLHVPSPFFPFDKTHLPSQRFLVKEQLKGFFFPDDDEKVAHDLVKMPRVKELIETMTLAEEPLIVTSQMLQRQGKKCSVTALKRYCAFYWDLALVDSVEVHALLRLRVERLVIRADGEEVHPYDRLQHEALKKASYKDPRRLVTDMPITPLAGLINRMRMGYMPSSVDLGRLAQATRMMSVVRAFSESMSGAPDSAARARDFSVVARVMTEIITEMGSPDLDLKKELQQLALQTEDIRPPTIHQLSGGHHTVDLQPMTTDKEIIDVE